MNLFRKPILDPTEALQLQVFAASTETGNSGIFRYRWGGGLQAFLLPAAENEAPLETDCLAGFHPDIPEDDLCRIRIITETLTPGDFILNTTLSALKASGRLEIECRTPAEIRREEEEERLRRNPLSALQGEEREKFLERTIKRLSGTFSSYDPENYRKALDILSSVTYPGQDVLSGPKLRTPYFSNALHGWPDVRRLPDKLKQILGPAYSKRSISHGADSEGLYSEAEMKVMTGAAVAWPIPVLENTFFAAPSQQVLGGSLQAHIRKLTGLPFVVNSRGGFGGVGAYYHFHTSAAIALRESEPNVVFLELYGRLLVARGEACNTASCQRYLAEKNLDEGKMAIIEGPLVFQVDVATLANRSHPGIGIPFYM